MLRLGEILYLGFIVTVCVLRITDCLKHSFSAEQVALFGLKTTTKGVLECVCRIYVNLRVCAYHDYLT